MKEIKNVAEYQSLVKQEKPILLDFYADWCGPCQSLMPVVEKLATQYDGEVEIVKVNVDTNGELAQQFGVRSIPALFFVQDEKIQERLVGFQSATVLNNKIQGYLAKA